MTTLLEEIHKGRPCFDVITAANINITHVNIEDYNLLVDACNQVIDAYPVYPENTGEGFIFWIEHEYDAEELSSVGFSQDFIDLYRYVQQSPKHMTHIWLDIDGEHYEELKTFNHPY